MLSLFIRNLLFTILQPGLVAGLIPLWITGFRINNLFGKVWQLHHYIGIIVFLIGFVIMLWCIISFAIKGRGTLSPADPTKRLVVAGLYKFSRNPMYVGVTLILIGEAIFFQSVELWIYLLLVFITFNIFVILIEEPRLRNDFGEEYQRYCEKVRRWI
ncbi:isoprenylcysteine carboxylmethyltransferase family protein [Algibacter sp. 2305UL17-15]|uniref:methyltransferase family protein n=1 Tax=Algibacter sp. 2305UL17-15 TaxID=3231268 RepID=UPI003457958A